MCNKKINLDLNLDSNKLSHKKNLLVLGAKPESVKSGFAMAYRVKQSCPDIEFIIQSKKDFILKKGMEVNIVYKFFISKEKDLCKELVSFECLNFKSRLMFFSLLHKKYPDSMYFLISLLFIAITLLFFSKWEFFSTY